MFLCAKTKAENIDNVSSMAPNLKELKLSVEIEKQNKQMSSYKGLQTPCHTKVFSKVGAGIMIYIL
jgi:hypothetical protein